jgi:hypothetical protein
VQTPAKSVQPRMSFAAVQESVVGTNLPIRNVRHTAAFGGKPDIDPAWPKGRV